MSTVTDYAKFLDTKRQLGKAEGFKPLSLPNYLKDFQAYMTDRAIRQGRHAIFANCGLGKTPMQLVYGDNCLRKTNKPVLIIAPLAVSHQTVREGVKFGVEVIRCADGKIGGPAVYITNYERLEHFDQSQFGTAILDESSILKSFTGARRKAITRFMLKLKYRLLCTATAAPNDYVELGTSSEALGELSHSEMLRRFFKQLDDKGQKKEQRIQDASEMIIADDPSYYQKLAYRVAQTIGQWRLKHYAVEHFWRWVASWSVACRMPSDLGFSDDEFILPELIRRDHVITPRTPPPGMLFNIPAFGMGEEREERKRTLADRTEFVANLVDHKDQAVVWCHTNAEGDALEKAIDGAEQVAGRTPDDRKEELYEAFVSGQVRVLVIKPKIGAFGLNWQHCNHVVTYPSHSYEQFFQLMSRCYRFGQKRSVTLDVVATEGELRVLGNLKRKEEKAKAMFDALVRQSNNANRIERTNPYTNETELPAWL